MTSFLGLIPSSHHHYTSRHQFDFSSLHHHCYHVHSRHLQVHGSRYFLYMLHFIHEGMGFDHWVFGPSFPSFLSPYHLSLRYVLSLKTTLRPWHHTLCLIALMWAILGIDSRAFWLWWIRSYGMTLHWGIAISESFFYQMTIMSRHTLLSRWWIFEPCPFLRGYQMSSFTLEHETWLAHFIWCTLHRGIPLSVDDGFFRYSCFLEAIRFISHWSTRYDWVISLMWSQEHNLLIIVDMFLRWLDQDTDTYESLQQSLVILEFALYWGTTLSLAVDLRDISSHWDMLFL